MPRDHRVTLAVARLLGVGIGAESRLDLALEDGGASSINAGRSSTRSRGVKVGGFALDGSSFTTDPRVVFGCRSGVVVGLKMSQNSLASAPFGHT